MGHLLSTLAEVPLGNVLVNDVQAVNISENDCLTASLWITGVDGVCVGGGRKLKDLLHACMFSFFRLPIIACCKMKIWDS